MTTATWGTSAALALGLLAALPAGAGVDLGNGSYFRMDDDFNAAADTPRSRLVQALTRVYSSAHGTGLFGRGWCTELETRLEVEGGTAVLSYCGDGRRVTMKSSKGAYRSARSGGPHVLKAGAHGFVYSRNGQPVYGFDRSGRLETLYDGDGREAWRLWYGGGRLGRISPATGEGQLVLDYNPDGMVSSLSFADTPDAASYAYGPGAVLAGVSVNNQPRHHYRYDERSRNMVEAASGEREERMTYWEDGRIFRWQDKANCHTDFTYEQRDAVGEGKLRQQVAHSVRSCMLAEDGEAERLERDDKTVRLTRSADAASVYVDVEEDLAATTRMAHYRDGLPAVLRWMQKDWRERQVNFTHDRLGRVKHVLDTLSEAATGTWVERSETRYAYADGESRRIAHVRKSIKAASREISELWWRYRYDSRHRVVEASGSVQKPFRLRYDAQNRIVAASEKGGSRFRIGYEGRGGKPAMMEIPGKMKVNVTYDSEGNIASTRFEPPSSAPRFQALSAAIDLLEKVQEPLWLDPYSRGCGGPSSKDDPLGIVNLVGMAPCNCELMLIPQAEGR